jgi:putative membrane protein
VLADTTPYPDPWAFQPHPEVWLLIASLVGAYIYLARVIGPKAVPAGQPPVTRSQWWCFAGGIGLLWAGADWPVHDIGEGYLYSVHMFQHMVFSYFAPPLLLMATPEWMMRTLLGTGRTYKVAAWFSKPVVAGFLFNIIVMVTHIPLVVNTSADNGLVHYLLHLFVVLLALLMWMPVVGPIPEWQMKPLGKCVYLFLMSVVPTVPAGWLTFAEGTVYKHYRTPVRVWGISVTNDQQLAGAIMKIGGAAFLWGVTIYIFFKKYAPAFDRDNSYVRSRRIPPAEITGNDETTLTFDDVSAAFDRSSPPLVEAEEAPRDQR